MPHQNSSKVSSRAMTMLPAESPQSTGSETPVIAELRLKVAPVPVPPVTETGFAAVAV